MMLLEKEFNRNKLPYRNVYMVGIGGAGMSALALLLKDKGFGVRGSDIKESYNVAMLRGEGIDVYLGHKKENISSEIEIVVYSSAVNEDNPEIQEAHRRGIPVVSRGKMLGVISQGYKTIAIAGSHGKTTTTALLGYVMDSLGYSPTLYVGGTLLNYQRNAIAGKDYFVIETDESDGSFLYYNPWISVITNIDYEHLDYYGSIMGIKASFRKFAENTKDIVIACGDDEVVGAVLSGRKYLSYGFSKNNLIRASNVSSDGINTFFDLTIGNIKYKGVKIPLLGEHNVLNTLAVLGFFYYRDIDLNKVVSSLGGFKGTRRRFEFKARVKGITFIDDYAHHPREIESVLLAAKKVPHKRIVGVFQPHRYSRVKLLYQKFRHCFKNCDYLVVTDIYPAGEKPIPGVHSNFLFDQIRYYFNGEMVYIPEGDLARELPSHLKEGDVVLGLGAGNINTIMDEVVLSCGGGAERKVAT